MASKQAKSDALIQAEVDKALALQQALAPQLQQLKSAQDQIDATWENVKATMEKHNVKSLKGEWGSLTIAERDSYQVDESKLPDEFFKRAPDMAKIGSTTVLMGEPPEGVTPRTTRYLVKRLKKEQL